MLMMFNCNTLSFVLQEFSVKPTNPILCPFPCSKTPPWSPPPPHPQKHPQNVQISCTQPHSRNSLQCVRILSCGFKKRCNSNGLLRFLRNISQCKKACRAIRHHATRNFRVLSSPPKPLETQCFQGFFLSFDRLLDLLPSLRKLRKARGLIYAKN